MGAVGTVGAVLGLCRRYEGRRAHRGDPDAGANRADMARTYDRLADQQYMVTLGGVPSLRQSAEATVCCLAQRRRPQESEEDEATRATRCQLFPHRAHAMRLRHRSWHAPVQAASLKGATEVLKA